MTDRAIMIAAWAAIVIALIFTNNATAALYVGIAGIFFV